MSHPERPDNDEQTAQPSGKKTWSPPTCTNLDDVKIEGGGAITAETATGLTS